MKRKMKDSREEKKKKKKRIKKKVWNRADTKRKMGS